MIKYIYIYIVTDYMFSIGGKKMPPSGRPRCGWEDELCPSSDKSRP